MLRILFWIALIYFAWKLYQIFSRRAAARKHLSDSPPDSRAFDNIQDAEFEDVTNKRSEKQQ